LSAAKTYAAACQVLNTATADGAKALDVTIDESVVRAYARHASVELQPVATFAGGVVAQEVVKRSGKYTPIDGFAHFAFLETMPDPPPALADRAPRGDRYDDLASVFGRSFVEKLGDLNYFLVGSGALGCEFVKNFALCGVCCGPEGSLTIADADRIELSNLTRQFLFREHNVGQSKALAAAAMATNPGGRTRAPPMNEHLKVTCHEAYVGPATEKEPFTDEFWEGLDGVCNALDNMEARFYVETSVEHFKRPSIRGVSACGRGDSLSTCSSVSEGRRVRVWAENMAAVPRSRDANNSPHRRSRKTDKGSSFRDL